MQFIFQPSNKVTNLPAGVVQHGGADGHHDIPFGLQDNVGKPVEAHGYGQLLLQVPGSGAPVESEALHLK